MMAYTHKYSLYVHMVFCVRESTCVIVLRLCFVQLRGNCTKIEGILGLKSNNYGSLFVRTFSAMT